MGNPVVFALDFIFDGSAVAISAWPIDKALLDQPAGESIEFRNPAGPRDRAPPYAAVWFNGEQKCHSSADPRVTKVPWNIVAGDCSGDLLKVSTAIIVARAIAACAPAGPRTSRRSTASASP